MARKTITIESESYARLAAARRTGETFSQTIDRLSAIKTNADALTFYRGKKTWLSPKKIELIERFRSNRRRSPRSLGPLPLALCPSLRSSAGRAGAARAVDRRN